MISAATFHAAAAATGCERDGSAQTPPSARPGRPAWSLQPTLFNLYEDLSGRQYVLIQETGLQGGVWLAMRLNGPAALTMLSLSNLRHLVLVGRVQLAEKEI